MADKLHARLGYCQEIFDPRSQVTDKAQRSRDASVLIIGAAREALDLGYDVILDGIFNLRDYSALFKRLHEGHRGQTRIYQFDIGLDETIRRHAGRPLSIATLDHTGRDSVIARPVHLGDSEHGS